MTRIFTVLLAALLLSTCIEPWDSGIDEQVELISFDAGLIKGEEVQRIVLTRSTTLVRPSYLPLRDCDVRVEDDQMNEFVYTEVFDGEYEAVIPDEDLVVGRAYRVIVNTPDGDRYVSEFDTLNAPVPVDSVYFEIDDEVDPITGEGLTGLQFYIDVRSSQDYTRYFRWKLDETWEYTMVAPISYYYDMDFGELVTVVPEDPFEVYRCYNQADITKLFLSNTVNLALNEKKKIALQYVSTETDKLRIRYSLMVRQYTLNEKAYRYWDQIRTSLQDSDGLYTSQPGQPITNVVNVNDTTEQVLGYFWTASMTKKRLTFNKPKGLSVPPEHCELEEFDYVAHIIDGTLPCYIYFDEGTGLEMTAPYSCFDCRFRGGELEKPEYWDGY